MHQNKTSQQNSEDVIKNFKKSEYYQHYKPFFDENLRIYDKLQEQYEAKGSSKQTETHSKIEKNLVEIITKINEIENSKGFQSYSKEAQNLAREKLTISLLASQNVDRTRENVSGGKIAKSFGKLAGLGLLTGGMVVGIEAIPLPFVGTVSQGVVDGITAAVVGATMKDVLWGAAKEFGKDVYAKISPEKYLDRSIEKTMKNFDMQKWNSVHAEVAKPAFQSNARLEVLNEITNDNPQRNQIEKTSKERIAKDESNMLENLKASEKTFSPELKKNAEDFYRKQQDSQKQEIELKTENKVETHASGHHTHHANDLQKQRLEAYNNNLKR